MQDSVALNRTRPDSLRGESQAETGLHWVWQSALALFVLAGATGALMRVWMLAGFPQGINFLNVRHAHSHLMYFGWVTPALMALIAARLPAQTQRLNPPGFGLASGLALFFALLSYPAFFFWGYQPAEISGQRLPLSVIASSFNILAWYAYIILYWRATYRVSRNRPLRLWDAALVFMVLASTGAWGRAVLAALKVSDPFLGQAMVHLFLDLFSEGWFVLAILGLAYAAQPELARRVAGREDWLLFLGLPFTFLLGIPLHLVPSGLRLISGLGGLAVAAGLALHLRRLWPVLGRGSFYGWRLPLVFLGAKIIFEVGVSLTPLALWGERMGLRIFYLHLLLLGFVTLALLASAAKSRAGERAMSWTVLLLLASLLPLTGLWPQALGGRWALTFAALAAFGPALAGLYLLFTPGRRFLVAWRAAG